MENLENVLILRASDGIWNYNDSEGEVIPGKRRPVIVIDESIVYLANITKLLTTEMIIDRVKSIIKVQEIPITVELLPAAWINDSSKQRPRIIASMTDHSYIDLKMIIGVDYIGQCAGFQLQFAIEPEPLPVMKEITHPEPLVKPETPEMNYPIDMIIAVILGVLLIFSCVFIREHIIAWIGGLLIAYGIFRFFVQMGNYENKTTEIQTKYFRDSESLKADYERRVMLAKVEYEAETTRIENSKALENIKRTYRTDDMRLFCTVMKTILQVVIDDVIAEGGEIVRIDNGTGGYFSLKINSYSAVKNIIKTSTPTQNMTPNPINIEVITPGFYTSM